MKYSLSSLPGSKLWCTGRTGFILVLLPEFVIRVLQQARALLTNAIYLENAGVTIDNVTFWGSPYTLSFLTGPSY